jgi:hypothetical protein
MRALCSHCFRKATRQQYHHCRSSHRSDNRLQKFPPTPTWRHGSSSAIAPLGLYVVFRVPGSVPLIPPPSSRFHTPHSTSLTRDIATIRLAYIVDCVQYDIVTHAFRLLSGYELASCPVCIQRHNI